MARYHQRGQYKGRGRSSSYTTPKSDKPYEKEAWEPLIDKNPLYRTHAIFCRASGLKLKLVEAKQNFCTPESIHILVDDPIDQEILEELGKHGILTAYRMACNHVQKVYPSNRGAPGTVIPCKKCGEKQHYWVLHHEWGHHWFDSFNPLIALFEKQCAEDYVKLAPGIDQQALAQFLNFCTNLYDDLRGNSLLYHVYPGAAEQLDIRWRRLTEEKADLYRRDFLQFSFSVALEVPGDGGEFEPLRSIIDWCARAVRGKSVENMLYAIRVMLDRCIGTILTHMPPEPPKMDMPPPGAPSPQDGIPMQGLPGPPSSHAGGAGIPQASSAQGLGAAGQDLANALQKLLDGSNPHNPGEPHYQPTDLDLAHARGAKKAQQLAAAILGMDIDDVAQLNAVFTQITDQKSQLQLGKLQKDLAKAHSDSQLSSDAKARILFIDVPPEAINPNEYVELNPFDAERVERLHGIFNRIMGRRRVERVRRGFKIDTRAFISYLARQGVDDDSEGIGGSSGNERMFKRWVSKRGFAYFVLVDMSGSMSKRFGQVCTASEILKQALDFPFVQGTFWGFQGGHDLQSVSGVEREPPPGEVWLLRYDPDCRGYLGEVQIRLREGTFPVPVCCNGITPMNTAVRVAVKNFIINYPPSVKKVLYLLTDGSPLQNRGGDGRKTSHIPQFLLQQWVAKEIGIARNRGVRVQTLIIGDAIPDHDARRMFGLRTAWKRVKSDDDVGDTLAKLILDQFSRYLESNR